MSENGGDGLFTSSDLPFSQQCTRLSSRAINF